ncbi:MAG: hypothetical protein HY298_11755 [Verrucomicrobia bacterium]|nr:hypothetical protein [Verrucomicrobiota bacterium]
MKSDQTKAVRTSMFRVRCWRLNVAVLATAASALADVHYVDVTSTNAAPPYTNWTTAATNIQDAVDAAVAGDEIVVTNGTYAPLSVGKPLSVRSVNGPQFTVVDGGNAVRCAYLAASATLSGFTLTRGSTGYSYNLTNGFFYKVGGGVVGFSASAVVSNCVITGNHLVADNRGPLVMEGGGAYGVTLNNCTLTNNSVDARLQDIGGWAWEITAGGGGAARCTLNNCTLARNSANVTDDDFGGSTELHGYAEGGGALFCTLNNCTLSGNAARGTVITRLSTVLESYGGGAYGSTLNNCTLNGNEALVSSPGPWGEAEGGGAYGGTLNNCIVLDGYGNSSLNHCWTTAPLFVNQASGNLRLQSNSPCINAGRNAFAPAGPDLDGNPRIVGGSVDIGAYEFQSPASMISYAWLQHFNLPINPATDTTDPDGDGVNNYREWLAGSDPTNPFSFPPLLTLIPYGANVILTWPTNAFGFTLQSTTNLGSSAVWSANSPGPVVIGGQNVVINPITGPQQFFRLSQ